MNDVDLKTLLDEKADEMRLGPRIPPSVLRRARRRRAGTAALTGAVTVGLALGAVVGARALLEDVPSARRPQVVTPGGTTSLPPVWPAPEIIEATQEQVAEGHSPWWAEDPEGVAMAYARELLGWDGDDMVVNPLESDPLTLAISNPTLSHITTRLTMAVAEGEPGPRDDIYVVAAADAEGLTIDAPLPGDPVVPGSRLVFVGRFRLEDPGLSVDVSLEWPELTTGSGAAGGEASFRLPVHIPPEIEGAPVARVAVHEGTDDPILALTSFRLGAPQGSVTTTAEPPTQALPRPVVATRDAILAAVQAREWESLRAIIPDEGFTFMFGGSEDPITYWQQLEQEGTTVLPTLETLLERTAARASRGVFIWPEQAVEDPRNWDDKDRILLRLIHTDREIRSFERFGSYLGWRVGIDRDGTWMFFVAGD